MFELGFAPTTQLQTRPQVNLALAQVVRLLPMTLPELQQRLEAVLAENPALEVEPPRRCRGCGRPVLDEDWCPYCRSGHTASREPILFFQPWTEAGFDDREDAFRDPWEQTWRQPLTLAEYVARQVLPELDADQRPIAEAILAALDDDGLLTRGPADIARELRRTLAEVQAVLQVFHQADPLGVAATSPIEALRVQAEILAQAGAVVPPGVFRLLEAAHPRTPATWREWVRRAGLTPEEAEEAQRFMREHLNPYPGRAQWGDPHLGGGASVPLPPQPDVILRFLRPRDPDSPIVIEILSPLNGRLRLQPLWTQAIREADPDARADLVALQREAELWIRVARHRDTALAQLMRWLVQEQEAFLRHGPLHLKPMNQTQAARALGVSPSTVSRLVNGKFVQLPDGRVIPLRQFFEPHWPAREALKALIARETRPLSDAALAQRLQRMGFRVARRTVAKYRQIEGIPPAGQRRKHAQPNHKKRRRSEASTLLSRVAP
ncbi:MAG: helix-turn-helix domain-containing protein [Chloroflexi bacterium]|nr:helix-turn-helix domain-containing protein [Chloroflexota bacterium]